MNILPHKRFLSDDTQAPKRMREEAPLYPREVTFSIITLCQGIFKNRQCNAVNYQLIKRIYEICQFPVPPILSDFPPRPNTIYPDPSDTMLDIALKLRSSALVRLLVDTRGLQERVIPELLEKGPFTLSNLLFAAELLPNEILREHLFRPLANNERRFRAFFHDPMPHHVQDSLFKAFKSIGGFQDLLQIAIIDNDHRLILSLISYGANLNQCSLEGKSPLHLAVEQRRWEIVQLLLRNGADPFIKDQEGFIPFCSYNPQNPAELQETLLRIVCEVNWRLHYKHYRDTPDHRSRINRLITDLLLGKRCAYRLCRAKEKGYLHHLIDVMRQVAPGADQKHIEDHLYTIQIKTPDADSRVIRRSIFYLRNVMSSKAYQSGYHVSATTLLIDATYQEFFANCPLSHNSNDSYILYRFFFDRIGSLIPSQPSKDALWKDLIDDTFRWKRQAAIELLLSKEIIRPNQTHLMKKD